MMDQLVHLFVPHLRPQAYLDPGSGSLIVQLVIAGLMGAGLLLRVFWKKIKRLFNRSESKKEDDSDTPS